MDDIRKAIAEMETQERELLQQRSEEAEATALKATYTIDYGVPLFSIILVLIGFFLARNISNPLEKISSVTEKLATGDLSVSMPTLHRRDEIGVLMQTFNQMIANLRETTRKNDEQGWLKSNLAKFNRMLQGQRNLETVSRQILSELAPLVDAQQGIFYILDSVNNQPILKLLNSYAYQELGHLSSQFHLGEGLVGQCALEKKKILLTEVPGDYLRISSGLGEAVPLNIIVFPVLFETQVTAVIELASFHRFSEIHLTFLDQLTESIAVVLNTISSDMRTEELLKQSQSLAEELQIQQAELKESNNRLEQQALVLQSSEELLKQQQEELQHSNDELQQLNEELEERSELLALQNREVERQNQEIEQARRSLEEKAEQLALTSKYKSEFLANMSHELRTPLNSLLILAKLLADNSEENLTTKQVEYSRTIYGAGTELLGLINDILDLAKIESGTMSIDIDQLLFSDLRAQIERTFRQVAQDKQLNFVLEFDPQLPQTMQTDAKRLQQVLKNLLSNAFKFTERGEVRLKVEVALPQERSPQAETVIAFRVSDTGIGIASDKQKVIFEAFQQADGTTSRKYGGTGLGLSISREIAQLLGGEIQIFSTVGQGSTFTLYLPQGSGGVGEQGTRGQGEQGKEYHLTTPPPHQPMAPAFSSLADDQEIIQPQDQVLLIVEDDLPFAQILLELARQSGFKGVVAPSGSLGLAMAREFQPSAIMLDIRLPGLDGWTVLERLKHDPNTRHIPVHIISASEGQQRSLQQGALAYLQKPVTSAAVSQALSEIKGFIDRQVKHLLVVEDDETQRRSIIELIGNSDVRTTAVGTGAAALAALSSGQFDCLVLDLGLPDMSGFELIEQLKQQPNLQKLPIVVYTAQELTRAEEMELRRMAETIIIKDVRSPERLLDETALFLHRVQAKLPSPQRQMLEQLRVADQVLAGKKVLIVDDDMRNIFALTSLLERQQMQVVYAENGADALLVLQQHPDVHVVLMDVMMPEMDGYETMRAIRQEPRFSALPMLALTAKAMQGDREKCIAAGASDYITKPVDTEQLLSLLRVWLYR
ncbi:MAG: response regulator [Chroococcidiopsidaceae cyanobacterium CP_BM_RX_35]|nr:response regulator [Chroococcidiopsidaceae cyanobacterium CP_BM_RX_35]